MRTRTLVVTTYAYHSPDGLVTGRTLDCSGFEVDRHGTLLVWRDEEVEPRGGQRATAARLVMAFADKQWIEAKYADVPTTINREKP
jgi:hypothetical protein